MLIIVTNFIRQWLRTKLNRVKQGLQSNINLVVIRSQVNLTKKNALLFQLTCILQKIKVLKSLHYNSTATKVAQNKTESGKAGTAIEHEFWL